MKTTLLTAFTLLILLSYFTYARGAEPIAYEYKVFPTKMATGFSNASASDLQETLNELSSSGWEVISITAVDRGANFGVRWFAVVGKRPKTQESKGPGLPQMPDNSVNTDASR